jgi:hypothetical protein
MTNQPPSDDFEKAAAADVNGSLIGELWGFLKHNKKWWLLPIICVLLLVGVFAFLMTTGVAPFLYTFF